MPDARMPATLPRILSHNGIHVRNQRHDSGGRGQGYDSKDFTIHWNALLPGYDARLNERYGGESILE